MMMNSVSKHLARQRFTIRILALMAFLLPATAYTEGHTSEKHFSSGDNKVMLLELFTSEGCSSCPPAEKWLNSLKDDPRLWKQFVPLAFHVDYWDYIGWKDPFASSEYGLRQREYRKQGNIRTVYTPGMILNGKEWRRWHYKRSVPPTDAIVGNLDVAIKNDIIKATFSPAGQQATEWELNVAVLGFQLHSRVNAGENSGRKLDQEFVVLAHKKMLSRDGNWQMTLPKVNTHHAKHTGLATWVNRKGIQTPIQATGGWLNK